MRPGRAGGFPPPALSFRLGLTVWVRALELPMSGLHYHQIRARRSRDGPTVITEMLTIPPEPRNAFSQEG